MDVLPHVMAGSRFLQPSWRFDVYYKRYGVVKEFPPSCQMFNGWVRAVLARFEESSDVEDCHMIPQSCYLSQLGLWRIQAKCKT